MGTGDGEVDSPSNEPWIAMTSLRDCTSRDEAGEAGEAHERDDVDAGLLG